MSDGDEEFEAKVTERATHDPQWALVWAVLRVVYLLDTIDDSLNDIADTVAMMREEKKEDAS
jgi:hypothetical protein